METPRELSFKYRYIRELGEGANGKTWLAKQLSTGRNVAIKAFKFSQMRDFKAFELFKREADVLQNIDVPGVPKFYEFIQNDSGNDACYIIQEYVPYPSLQSLLDQKKSLSESEILTMMTLVLGVLHKLQTQYTPPVIHRDIKPSNILYYQAKDSNLRDLALIDFGAVANPQKRSGGSTVAGTFGYMAPEQMIGDVFPTSDFYSLGMTALHALTGIAPIDMPSNGFQIDLDAVLKDTNISKPLAKLIKALIEPQHDKRPQKADEIIEAIKRVKNGSDPFDETNLLPIVPENPNNSAIAQIFSNPPNIFWKEAVGTFRGISETPNCDLINDMYYAGEVSEYSCIEYTFEANGKLWVGFYYRDYTSKAGLDIKDANSNLSLIIYYNPDDPRMNFIHAIEMPHS